MKRSEQVWTAAIGDEPWCPSHVLAFCVMRKVHRERPWKVLAEGNTSADAWLGWGHTFDRSRWRYDGAADGITLRSNGTRLDTAGLVWAQFGETFVQKFAEKRGISSKHLADALDETLVQGFDDGVTDQQGPWHQQLRRWPTQVKVVEGLWFFLLNSCPLVARSGNHSTRKEKEAAFEKAAAAMDAVLSCYLGYVAEVLSAVGHVRSCDRGKPIMVLKTEFYWKPIVQELKHVRFVVYPNSNIWTVRAVTRKRGLKSAQFPSEWAGKIGRELAELTGSTEAVMCKSDRLECIFLTKRAALKGASLALTLLSD